MKKVLYLTRNGLMEPLGQSQIMSYLRGLACDYRITIITFEKKEDLDNPSAEKRVRSECKVHGIRWLPQRFHYYPRGIAPAWSIVVLFYLSLREVRLGARLIHARSYIPAVVALLINRLIGVPFIFDMRGLWPEELITCGRIRRKSLLHLALIHAERICLRRATAVVSLTKAAVSYLKEAYPEEFASNRVYVIPTCADLARFKPAPVAQRQRIIGCVGTVLSGWFRLDWLSTFFRVAATCDPKVWFEIVTRDAEEKVRTAVGGGKGLQERLSIYSKPPQEVHEAIQRQTASVMFYAGGVTSELGRSPTRMGEVLGCGRPIVTNAGVGDVAQIIEHYRVGVVVHENSETEMNQAFNLLEDLLADPGIEERCRTAAKEIFSLARGTEALREIYYKSLAS